MSLMKSSEGKRFSGELRIFISHTRNLTCRLVGSGNLSHEIVVLRVAPSPAAFGNYLTHRLPLDRLPSVEMHLLSTKSGLFPLPVSLRSWCRSPAATKGSPVSSQEPESPLPGARSLGKCNYISDAGWLCRCCAHPAFPQQNQVCTTEPPGAPLGFLGTAQPPTRGGFPARGAFYPSPSTSMRGEGWQEPPYTGSWRRGRFGAVSTPHPAGLGCFGVRVPQGCREHGTLRTRDSAKPLWGPWMFNAHTLSPNCVKYGARMLSNTQTW